MANTSGVKIIRCILLIILAADLIFIFYNSSKDATSSGSQSARYSKVVAKALTPDFDELSEDKQFSIIETFDSVVRECAHAAEFVPVGFCPFLLLVTEKKLFSHKTAALRVILCAVIGMAFAAVYALSDEIHQLFVPGRAFQLFDIAVDLCGSFIGCAAAIIIWFAYRITASQKNNKKSIQAKNP